MSLAEFDGVLNLNSDDTFEQFTKVRAKLDRIELDAEVIRESSMLREGYGPNPFVGVNLAELSRTTTFNPLRGGNSGYGASLNAFEVSRSSAEEYVAVITSEESSYISLARTEKSIWLSLVVAALFVGCFVSTSIFVEGLVNPAIAFLALGVVLTLSLTTFFARRELRKTQ